MAKGDFYFPLYYKRILTSTIGWKDDEFGAYMRLLIYQFDNGSIPSDMSELVRIAPTAKKHWKLLSKKFKDDGKGGLINEVMADIHEDVQYKKEKNRENGRKGGRKKEKANPTVTERLTEGVTQTEAIPIVNSKYQIVKENTAPLTFFTIEHCLTIAMNDSRWVKNNKVLEKDLIEFNAMLEKRGIYEKNPADYKTHYANWKAIGKKEETGQESSKSSKIVEDENLKKLRELHGQSK